MLRHRSNCDWMPFLSSPMTFIRFEPGPVGYNPSVLTTKPRLLPQLLYIGYYYIQSVQVYNANLASSCSSAARFFDKILACLLDRFNDSLRPPKLFDIFLPLIEFKNFSLLQKNFSKCNVGYGKNI